MDSIVFNCKKCGSKLVADVEESQAEFECPDCHMKQIVPVLADAGGLPKRVSTGTRGGTQFAAGSGEGAYGVEARGNGLRMFSVALGTVGGVLCILSLIWAVFSLYKETSDWWVMLLMFISTFLSGLMGLVLAQLSRFMVNVAERLDDMEDI